MSHLWSELHTRALARNGINDSVFLNSFAARIPSFEGGCKCRSFYNNWRRANPPDFNHYFEWTVRLHNAVNFKLNKPHFTLEEARRRWTRCLYPQPYRQNYRQLYRQNCRRY
jgi:hypothetical protein